MAAHPKPKPSRIISRFYVCARPYTANGKRAKREWCVVAPYGAVWRFSSFEAAHAVMEKYNQRYIRSKQK